MTTRVKITLDTEALDALHGDVLRRSKALVDSTTHALFQAVRAGAPEDEGELKDSLEEFFPGREIGIVRASTDYVAHVELGTSVAKAKPFIRPAVKKLKSQFLGGARKVFEE